jgi:hypothetical protein
MNTIELTLLSVCLFFRTLFIVLPSILVLLIIYSLAGSPSCKGHICQMLYILGKLLIFVKNINYGSTTSSVKEYDKRYFL